MSDDQQLGGPEPDGLDRQLRELAHAARDGVSVGATDVEATLHEVTSGAQLARLLPAPPGRRRWIAIAGAAAAVALFGGGAFWLSRADNQVRTAEPTVPPAPSGPVSTPPTAGPASTVVTTTAPVAQPPATQPPGTQPPGTQPLATQPPGTQPLRVPLELGDVAWEVSGIDRSCAPVSAPGGSVTQCTQLAIGPTGIPVSYDPVSRTLTRHVRADGEYVSAVLPESFGSRASLVAFGPDDVAYLNVPIEAGADGTADLVAVSLAPGDAGREIAREVGRGNPGDDADFVVVPAGIVSIGWYDQGPRPPADAPLAMAWVDREGPEIDDDSPVPDADPYPNGVRSVRIDAYGSTVSVEGRTWALTGTAAQIQPTGMPAIVGTFDGGFIARYDEVAGEGRQIVVRGFADGTVAEWLLPEPSPGDAMYAIPEPQGTVLIADGDWFVRVAPFSERANGWDGRLEIDVAAGSATAVGLDEFLAGLDWSQPQPPWDRGFIAVANAVAGPLDSPAELRTIQVVRSDAQTGVVAVVTEGHLDDSVYGTRLELTISSDRSVGNIGWSNTCQVERGHSDYRAALCT